MWYSFTEVHRTQAHRPFTYSEFLELQKKRITENQGGLLLAEIEPVITLGRRATESELVGNSLSPVLKTDRGGRATWHGPGQWILFPVLPGVRHEVKKITKMFLDVMKETAAEFNVPSECRSGEELGLWNAQGEKIGALGIRFSREGLSHGVSFNVYATPQSFQGLKPCGLDLPVGYLMGPGEGQATFEKVGEVLAAKARKALFSKG